MICDLNTIVAYERMPVLQFLHSDRNLLIKYLLIQKRGLLHPKLHWFQKNVLYAITFLYFLILVAFKHRSETIEYVFLMFFTIYFPIFIKVTFCTCFHKI